ncbi:glycosyltransferase family 4 protein [Fibrobacterota bacterium]
MGGSEIVYHGLLSSINPELREGYDICMTPRIPDKRKITVLYCQCSYDDSNWNGPLKDSNFVDMFDHIILVSHWQFEKFRQHFSLPEHKCHVIKNCIDPVGYREKPKSGKLKLIYLSTPNRGLDVLVDAFVMLGREDLELDVYSSFKIYGPAFEKAEESFKPLYDYCRQAEGVNYHGSVSNPEVRQALQRSHIFAYPSTFEETFCVALAEAMSAGCWPVLSNIGALPEISGGYGTMYGFLPSKREHAKRLAKVLDRVADSYQTPQIKEQLKRQVEHVDFFHSWERRAGEWQSFFETNRR